MYSAKAFPNWFLKAISSLLSTSVASSTIFSILACKNFSFSSNSNSVALSSPSTKTLVVPFGNLSICLILHIVPILYISSLLSGISTSGSFCVTKKILLSFNIASSRAAIDLSLPISKCIIILGKIVIPLRGINGNKIESVFIFPLHSNHHK